MSVHTRAITLAGRRASRRLTWAASAGAALVLVLAVSLLPVTAGAAVETDEAFTVPDSGTFTVQGRGFGHGHGMSQYGAEGAARRGLSAKQILAFYYPGTTAATSHAKIAVLITAATSRALKVKGVKGLRVRDLARGRTRSLPTQRKHRVWKLGVRKGETALFWRNHGRWHRYRPKGIKRFRGDAEFRVRSGVLTLLTPSGKRAYRGALRAARPAPGSRARRTVNVLGIDAYLRGVVPSEIPASWHPAAVQAQAVAARTYALRERRDHRGGPYHLCDTTACQVYGGVAVEHPLADRAIRATRGTYLRQGGMPAFTQFSASNGGWTSAGSMPYLPSREDPYDRWAGNPYRDWTTRVGVAILEKRYPALGDLGTIRITRREGGGAWQGRVVAISLEGSRGTVRISGDDFRYLYGLRSTWLRLVA